MSLTHRHRGNTSIKVVAVIAATVGVLLLPLPHEWSAGWRGQCLNRMHAPLMGLAYIALASGRSSGWLNSLRVALGTILAAALMEWVQPWLGRTASMQDFGWGVFGVFGGTLLNLSKMTPGHVQRGFMNLLAALFMLAPPGAWLAEVGGTIWQAHASFPELLGPHGKRLSLFWTVQPNKEQETLKKEGQIVLRSQQGHPATAHLNALGYDWSDFVGLELHGELKADAAVEVGVRVDLDDEHQTKLHTSGWMSPHKKHLRITWPEGRPPRKVRQLVVFLAPETPVASLTLTRLFLIKEEKDRSDQADKDEAKTKDS